MSNARDLTAARGNHDDHLEEKAAHVPGNIEGALQARGDGQILKLRVAAQKQAAREMQEAVPPPPPPIPALCDTKRVRVLTARFLPGD